MTTLTDRPRTAMIVIDVQSGVMAGAYRRDEVIGNIRTLVEKARTAGVPIVWIQHSDVELVRGSETWRYVDELPRLPDEPVVHKLYGDSFEGTDLHEVLARSRAGHLVVAGAESDACIRSTIHGAFTRGYDVTVVGDAHTTNDRSEWGAPQPEAVIAHLNLYWRNQTAPGRTASVVDTDEVSFADAGR